MTLDVAYLHQGEEVEDFKDFGTDFAGRPLKYKILVKDCEVYRVLYCDESLEKTVRELPKREWKIEVSGYYKQTSGLQRLFGKIDSVPTGMIACADHEKL